MLLYTTPVFTSSGNYEVLEGNPIGSLQLSKILVLLDMILQLEEVKLNDILIQDDLAINKSSGELTFKYAQDYDSMYDEEGNEYVTLVSN